jgi:hypothetical protein
MVVKRCAGELPSIYLWTSVQAQGRSIPKVDSEKKLTTVRGKLTALSSFHSPFPKYAYCTRFHVVSFQMLLFWHQIRRHRNRTAYTVSFQLRSKTIFRQSFGNLSAILFLGLRGDESGFVRTFHPGQTKKEGIFPVHSKNKEKTHDRHVFPSHA